MKHTIQKLTQAAIIGGSALLVAARSVFAAPPPIQIKEPVGIEGITNFNKFMQSSLTLAIIIAAVLTFAYLIWGGIAWITSGGDKAQYEAARNRITAALIGLAIVAGAYALMALIGYFFGVNIIEQGLTIPTAAGD